MSHASTSLLLFVAADSLFVIPPNRRSIAACAGGLLARPDRDTGVD